MHYAASLHYLNSFLNLERIIVHPETRRWNLDRMRWLLKKFAHPEKSFFPVIIAGTKGKGSTGFFLESILKESRIPVGFYSSPHLIEPRERIRINGKIVSKAIWTKGIKSIRRILSSLSLRATEGREAISDSRLLRPAFGRPRNDGKGFGQFTYFEIMTLLAALIFKKEKVRIGIFEVGMGGRFDATRLVNAKLAVLTPIHLDHEAFLGNTIAKIAREKAAVINRRTEVVVVAPQPEEAMREIIKQVKKCKAIPYVIPAFYAMSSPRKRGSMDSRLKSCGNDKWRITQSSIGLFGDFQRTNAAVALKSTEILKTKFGFLVTQKGIQRGLSHKNWPGRMESLGGKPEILIDAAHNPVSVEAFVRNINPQLKQRPSVLIFATSRDKNSQKMLETLSRYFKTVILTRFSGPRSQDLSVLIHQAASLFTCVIPSPAIPEALNLSKKMVPPHGLIAVTGSFYLIGEIRKQVKGNYI